MSKLYRLLLYLNRCNCGRNLHIRGLSLIYRYPNAHISIGESVTLRGFCIIIARGTGEIFIKDNAELENCKIITSDQVIYET